MRVHVLLIIAAGLFLLAGAGVDARADARADAKEDAKKELEKFQGTWSVVALEASGQKLPEEQLKQAGLKLIIKGNQFTYKAMDQTAAEGTFEIDPSKTPKTLDAKGTNPNGVMEETIGIYEFKGDTLQVCFVPKGGQRPKELKGGPGVNLITYKKDK